MGVILHTQSCVTLFVNGSVILNPKERRKEGKKERRKEGKKERRKERRKERKKEMKKRKEKKEKKRKKRKKRKKVSISERLRDQLVCFVQRVWSKSAGQLAMKCM